MKKLLLTFMLIFTAYTTGMWAEGNQRAVIIFDASGSMWGQIDGKTKIEIARDTLKNVIKKWNPNIELGLMVYGHRTKGDCNDIETVIPIGKIDKSKVISTVFAINPKGKTPISRSIKKAAKELRYTEEKATVILISDGKETCDPDPCGTAKQLEKEGIDFVTHVIGFGVDKKTDRQLECIANATGGEYFSAKNATALNEAMKVIVKKVEKPKPVLKKPKNNLEITASEKEGGKWINAFHKIYRVVDGEVDSDRIASCSSHRKKACLKQIPAGKYLIKSSYNEFKKETPFEIKPGEVTKVNVIFDGILIKVKCSDKEAKVNYEVYTQNGQLIYEKKAKCSDGLKLILDEGTYMIESKIGNNKKETIFSIGTDQNDEIVIDMQGFEY